MTIVEIAAMNRPNARITHVPEDGQDVTARIDACQIGHSATVTMTVVITVMKNRNAARNVIQSAISNVQTATNAFQSAGCAMAKMTVEITAMNRQRNAAVLLVLALKANIGAEMADAYES